MNENIDLTKILKDCPKGTKFYSTIFGEVEFYKIREESEYPIVFITSRGNNRNTTADGKYYGIFDGECTLFPSKEQRDWSKFTTPWLEKQDEQKPQGKSALEAIKEEKVDNANKVEPEFKVGDWITFYGGNPFKILKIEEEINGVLEYLLLDQNGHDSYFNKSYVDKNARLWTIQDAKDGDVLACKEEILLFKSYSVQGRISLYCWYNGQTNNFHSKEVVDVSLNKRNKICLATKEQRDTLMKAMNDAGYEWDAKKKELKKLVPNRFDPKTFKPFDKVLVRDDETCIWKADFYSHKGENRTHPFKCVSLIYKCCIPYNENTKHLVGTKEEAPEYYRYWEN